MEYVPSDVSAKPSQSHILRHVPQPRHPRYSCTIRLNSKTSIAISIATNTVPQNSSITIVLSQLFVFEPQEKRRKHVYKIHASPDVRRRAHRARGRRSAVQRDWRPNGMYDKQSNRVIRVHETHKKKSKYYASTSSISTIYPKTMRLRLQKTNINLSYLTLSLLPHTQTPNR